MAYVLRAHHTYDVETNENMVEVTVIGMEFGNKTDFLYTTPRGDWRELTFHHLEFMDYADFLRLMVHRTPDVEKKIAKVELMYLSDTYSLRVMNCLRLLDPTFRSPFVNIKNGHHMDLVNHINTVVAPRILEECMDTGRIITYANALRGMR